MKLLSKRIVFKPHVPQDCANYHPCKVSVPYEISTIQLVNNQHTRELNISGTTRSYTLNYPLTDTGFDRLLRDISRVFKWTDVFDVDEWFFDEEYADKIVKANY